MMLGATVYNIGMAILMCFFVIMYIVMLIDFQSSVFSKPSTLEYIYASGFVIYMLAAILGAIWAFKAYKGKQKPKMWKGIIMIFTNGFIGGLLYILAISDV